MAAFATSHTYRSEVAKHAEHRERKHLHRAQTEFERLVSEKEMARHKVWACAVDVVQRWSLRDGVKLGTAPLSMPNPCNHLAIHPSEHASNLPNHHLPSPKQSFNYHSHPPNQPPWCPRRERLDQWRHARSTCQRHTSPPAPAYENLMIRARWGYKKLNWFSVDTNPK